jgi:hypothetical protein
MEEHSGAPMGPYDGGTINKHHNNTAPELPPKKRVCEKKFKNT